MSKVSVVIPTYNRAEYVCVAIESVLCQDHKCFEVIVVDDGSTDSTREQLSRFSHAVRYIYQPNQGVSVARNTGITAARGEWVAFLDSDDEWLPGKLSFQMEALSARPDLVAHVVNALTVHVDGRVMDLFSYRGWPFAGRESGIIGRPLEMVIRLEPFTSTLAVRRSTLISCGMFEPGMSIYEDMDLMRRLALEGPWGITNIPFVRMWCREESPDLALSIQRWTRRSVSLSNIAESCSRLLRRKDLSPRERVALGRARAGALNDLALWHFGQGDRREARRNLHESLRLRSSWRGAARALAGILFGRIGLEMVERLMKFGKREEFRRSDVSLRN